MDRRNFIHLISVASAGLAAASELNGMQSLLTFGGGSGYPSYCNECLANCGTIITAKGDGIEKIEGNPNHPVNHGQLCARGKLALRGLHISNRIVNPLIMRNRQQEEISNEAAKIEFVSQFKGRLSNPEKIGFIAPLLTASEYKFFSEFRNEFKINNYLSFEPINYEYITQANETSFGKKAVPQYDFSDCDAVISFGCDFLDAWLSPVKFNNDYLKAKEKNVKFIYIGEGNTATALKADRQVKLSGEKSYYFALAVLNSLLYVCCEDLTLAKIKKSISKFTPDYIERTLGISKESVCDVIEIIRRTKRSVVVAGDDGSENSIKLMAVVNLINFLAGNYGKTIYFGNDYSHWHLSGKIDVKSFTDKLKNKKIDFVIIYKSNPINFLQKDFPDSLKNVYLASFSTIENDTTRRSNLVIPISMIQESWGDSESLAEVYNLHSPALESPKGVCAAGDIFIDIIKNIDPSLSTKYPKTYLEYLKTNWKQIQIEFGNKNDFNKFFKESADIGGVWKELPRERPFISEKILSLFNQ